MLRENTSRFCGEIFGLQSGKICMGTSTLNFCFTLMEKKRGKIGDQFVKPKI